MLCAVQNKGNRILAIVHANVNGVRASKPSGRRGCRVVNDYVIATIADNYEQIVNKPLNQKRK